MCECAALRRERDRLLAKLARHAAAREPEALAKRVAEIEPGKRWHVPSETNPGGYRVVIYTAYAEHYSCDCPSFTHRGDCRHVAAVSLSIQGRATANQLQTQLAVTGAEA